jgi:leucyl aminopeptidase (aminopeptidase T)
MMKADNLHTLTKDVRSGCETLINVCADLKYNETVLVVSDKNTVSTGNAIAAVASEISDMIEHIVIEPIPVHGSEPPEEITYKMLSSDVVFCVTEMSLAHSQARYNASLEGARFLSLPDYSLEVLAGQSMRADFRSLTRLSDWFCNILTTGVTVRINSVAGTDFEFRINGRTANAAPGWCRGPGSLASPPNAETNIAIVEGSGYGTIIVDGSIPHSRLGLLKSTVSLTVDNGHVVSIEGSEALILNDILDEQGTLKARVVAEFGIGLNPLAQLSGVMLEDEGCVGTVHFGLGSNITIGGKNKIPFHLDFVVRNVNIMIDNKIIVESGRFLTEE